MKPPASVACKARAQARAATLFAAYPRELPATLLGTNKCASVFGTSSAVAHFARSVAIPWRLLSPAVAVSLAASIGGAILATRIPPDVFRPLVPVLDGVARRWLTRSQSPYVEEVRERRFPEEQHTYAMPAGELELFEEALEDRAEARERG